jgi:spore coat polysaccharide biosynthesis protein SpsF (cytidylyltransferase family)
MNVLAITQARMGSSRLPGKVLKTVKGKTLLTIHLERLLKSKRINQLLVATTTNEEDKAIADLAISMHLSYYKGSVDNVLERFYQAAKPFNPLWVVRVTSDCPLIDAELVDKVIEKAMTEDLDYCSNTLESLFPDGEDVEVFKFSALEKAWKEATLNSDKEHVTPYIYRNSTFLNQNKFVSANYGNEENYGSVRLTVDSPPDLEVLKILIEDLGMDKTWQTYADCYLSNAEIKKINEHIARNEGYIKSLKND